MYYWGSSSLPAKLNDVPIELADILESDASIYDLRTRGAGPSGALPLTDDILRNWASGDIFGMTQDVGMGWNPARLGG